MLREDKNLREDVRRKSESLQGEDLPEPDSEVGLKPSQLAAAEEE
jgi:hypothetical protein